MFIASSRLLAVVQRVHPHKIIIVETLIVYTGCSLAPFDISLALNLRHEYLNANAAH